MRYAYGCLFFVLFIASSCGDGKRDKAETVVKQDSIVSSVAPNVADETIDMLLQHSDDSFDDFIYYFSSVPEFQRKRIKIPLPYVKNGNIRRIGLLELKHDSLFFGDMYFTRIFDDEIPDSMSDIETDSAIFEWIYMDKPFAKEYLFTKDGKKWFLDKIVVKDLIGDERMDFIDFFRKFATDSLFQLGHVSRQIAFVTSDPDDEFSVIKATIDKEQWNSFKPVFPKKRFSNFRFLNSASTGSGKEKILCLSGVENGFNNILHFKKRRGEWMLYKFEDLSN